MFDDLNDYLYENAPEIVRDHYGFDAAIYSDWARRNSRYSD